MKYAGCGFIQALKGVAFDPGRRLQHTLPRASARGGKNKPISLSLLGLWPFDPAGGRIEIRILAYSTPLS